jgi:hypothetical protein
VVGEGSGGGELSGHTNRRRIFCRSR